jgi:4-hydroxy 2-oxovalerate aldolase
MVKLVDCTLRDGGYYNSWDFPSSLINDYLKAMEAIFADYVEIGFRTLKTIGYKGGCGFSTDNYIRTLDVPPGVKIAVMINAGELVEYPGGVLTALKKLFITAKESPVSLVRIACHSPEIEPVMPGISWLKENGYLTTINFMQIADRTAEEIRNVAKLISNYPLDVLYFADSLGSLNPDQTAEIIKLLRTYWRGDIGIHTHDNMGQGLFNSIRAIEEGVTWVDGTVLGMGRGPGNTKTEYLTIELEKYRQVSSNPIKLFTIINKYFNPMREKYQWGSNPFYYLAGKYGIHPTYIQEMLFDTRYDEEDIVAVIEYLKDVGGKKFSLSTLETARNFYNVDPKGTWVPADQIEGREVLILGSGPGVKKHSRAIEVLIKKRRPFVIALNTQKGIDPELIDIRAACHPVRLLADCHEHVKMPQPLVTPASQLPEYILKTLVDKELLDFGISVQHETFAFNSNHCILPSSMVFAYALAIATSGKATRVLLAGFDGYGADDPRTAEMDNLIKIYTNTKGSFNILAITPTKYKMQATSVYAL